MPSFRAGGADRSAAAVSLRSVVNYVFCDPLPSLSLLQAPTQLGRLHYPLSIPADDHGSVPERQASRYSKGFVRRLVPGLVRP